MRKPTSVIHISSLPHLSEIMSNYQSAEDFNISRELYEPAQAEPSCELYETDILHLHGLLLLTQPGLRDLIRRRNENNKTVIVSLYKEEHLESDFNINSISQETSDLLTSCSAVFLQDGSLLTHFENLDNWSWASLPVNLNDDIPQLSDEKIDELNLLYFKEDHNQTDIDFISKTVETLCHEGLRFKLKIAERSSANNVKWAADLIESSHIFIESLDLPGPSYLSLMALSMGKTALANISELESKAAKQYELSPLLNTNKENLHYRLQSLAKQPKSLRDFGKRGREFIKLFHNPKEVGDVYLELYRQFIPTR